MTDIGTVTFSFDIDTSRLKAALLSEDDIGAMIRCHFEAERAAIHVLDAVTAGRFGQKRSRRYQYLSDKLDLLEIIGLEVLHLEPLRYINKHRNKFAHDGQDRITQTQVGELWGAVTRAASQLNEDTRFTFAGDDRYRDVRVGDLGLRERYVIGASSAIGLFAALPGILTSLSNRSQTPSG